MTMYNYNEINQISILELKTQILVKLLKIRTQVSEKIMFYLLRHLRTSLTFADKQIDQIGNSKHVWQKLRNKIQGKVTNEYGLIVHITNPEKQLKNTSSIYSLARVQSRGCCTLEIQFSALSFKASKNDLILSRIKQLSQDCISCQISQNLPISIKIPRAKLTQQLEYDRIQNIYKMKNKNWKIDIGDFIVCRCFDVKIFMGMQIQIIGEIYDEVLSIAINLGK